MTRSEARKAIAEKVAVHLASKMLPNRDNTLVEIPVMEQYAPVDLDAIEVVPGALVMLGDSVQTTGAQGQVRTAPFSILFVTYAEDSEQGFRDAENLMEQVRLDFVAEPWAKQVDDGSIFKLLGPWTDRLVGKGPTFGAQFEGVVEIPAAEAIVGPGGEAIGDMI